MLKQLLCIAAVLELALSSPLAQGAPAPPKTVDELKKDPQLFALYSKVLTGAKAAPITIDDYALAIENWGTTQPRLGWPSSCVPSKLCYAVGAGQAAPGQWSYSITGRDQPCGLAYFPGASAVTEDECRVTISAIFDRADRAQHAIGPLEQTRWVYNVIPEQAPTPVFPKLEALGDNNVMPFTTLNNGASEDPKAASWQIYAYASILLSTQVSGLMLNNRFPAQGRVLADSTNQ